MQGEFMKYPNICSGIFKSRPNRFIAEVEINGVVERCHVKNTGRCRELLIPGARVYVQRHRNPARKTALSLIAVEKDGRLVNIDSQAPNAVWQEALAGGLLLPGRPEAAALIRREAVFGDSRLDFYIEWPEVRGWMEVKGVTLEEQGVVRFPDAPTERGRKHLRELSRAAREGWYAAVVFVIQMEGVAEVRPHTATHPQFAEALAQARTAGVKVLFLLCRVEPDGLAITQAREWKN